MTKTDNLTPPIKAAMSGIELIALGAVRVNVDAFTAKRSEGTVAFKTICPDCDDPTPLPQKYECDAHGLFSVGELQKARLVDGELHRVTEEEIAAAKAPGTVDTGIVTIFESAEVEAHTRPNGAVYVLRPGRNAKTKKVSAEDVKLYGLLVDVIGKATSQAWIVEHTSRGSQKLYRLESWNDTLVMQELVRPGEFHATVATDKSYDPRLLDAMNEAAEALVAPFNPTGFENVMRERAAELDEAKRTGAPVPAAVAAATPKDNSGDLLALLAASTKMAKKAKKGPKAS